MEVQWPLVFFTLFIAMGAGVLAVLGILALAGRDKEVRIPAIVVSVCALAVGGCASVLHLQHLGRLFNGFGHLSSGITQELIFIVIAVIVAVIYFVVARRGDTPKWMGVLAIAAGVLLVLFMSHSYVMASRPAWNNVLLYAFYLSAGFLTGAATILVIKGIKSSDTAFEARLVAIAGAIQTVAILAYGVFATTLSSSYTSVGNYFDSTVPTQGMQDPSAAMASFLTGENALLFWGAALVLGSLVPLVTGILGTRKPGKNAAAFGGIGLVCALAGGIAFRAILYNVGFDVYVFF